MMPAAQEIPDYDGEQGDVPKIAASIVAGCLLEGKEVGAWTQGSW